jgi:hypothetical protein
MKPNFNCLGQFRASCLLLPGGYATAAEFHASFGETVKSAEFRRRGERIIEFHHRSPLKRTQQKWEPVLRQDTRQTKNLAQNEVLKKSSCSRAKESCRPDCDRWTAALSAGNERGKSLGRLELGTGVRPIAKRLVLGGAASAQGKSGCRYRKQSPHCQRL